MLPPPPPKNDKISSAFSYNFKSALTVYLSKQETFPLQLVLRGILTLNQVDTGLIQDYEDLIQRQNLVELMKYALIVVSSVPLIVIYPFFQKHFTKGIMVGSLKG